MSTGNRWTLVGSKRTILDLSHAGLDVVQRQVRDGVFQAVQIHLGRGLESERFG